jgi:hypothetical protein
MKIYSMIQNYISPTMSSENTLYLCKDWHATQSSYGGNNHIVTCAPNKVKFTQLGIHDLQCSQNVTFLEGKRQS